MNGYGSIEVPAEFNFGDVVDHWAESTPRRQALVTVGDTGAPERALTYRDAALRSCRIADQLSELGVRRGDRVLVMLPRGSSWQLTMVAALRLGAIPVPCITMLTPSDLDHRLRLCQPNCVVTTAENARKFDRQLLDHRIVVAGEAPAGWTSLEHVPVSGVGWSSNVAVSSSDPAVIYFTSGSTGHPKGATLSSGNLFTWRVAADHWLRLGPTDTVWCTADTGWSKACCSTLFGPWTRGSTVAVYDGPFDARHRLRTLERCRVTVYCAPATELKRVLNESVEEFDLSALRIAASAGESVDPALSDEWQRRTGTPLLDGYGQTENLMTVANRVGELRKPGSMGTPLPGSEVGVLTEGGSVEHRSAAGEIVVRSTSPNLMLGYWGDHDDSCASFSEVGDERWFRTGDMAVVDEDGYLWFQGRADDVINSSGYRIGPQEVENALLSHSAVAEAAVVGEPDADRGQAVVAFVVLASSETASPEVRAQLQAHVREQTAPYKYPRRVEFVETLPRTDTGKIRRNSLRDRLYRDLIIGE